MVPEDDLPDHNANAITPPPTSAGGPSSGPRSAAEGRQVQQQEGMVAIQAQAMSVPLPPAPVLDSLEPHIKGVGERFMVSWEEEQKHRRELDLEHMRLQRLDLETRREQQLKSLLIEEKAVDLDHQRSMAALSGNLQIRSRSQYIFSAVASGALFLVGMSIYLRLPWVVVPVLGLLGWMFRANAARPSAPTPKPEEPAPEAEAKKPAEEPLPALCALGRAQLLALFQGAKLGR